MKFSKFVPKVNFFTAYRGKKETLDKSQKTNEFFEKIIDKKIEKKKTKNRGTVDIIIPVYNSHDYVVRCIKSVIENSDNYRVIIIDDASTDAKVIQFLNELPKGKIDDKEIIIHRNSNNLGFVKSVNKGYEFVNNNFVVLNSDTEVPPRWLDRIFFPILNNENEIASVTPFSNSATICSFPDFLINNKLFKELDHETIDKFFMEYSLPLTFELPSGHGFCLAINKKVSNEIGLYDEVFGRGYGEENDWCMKAYKKGYKNVIITNLFVFHKHVASFTPDEKKALLKKNRRLVSKRHPEYDKMVQEFIRRDELQPLRDILSIIIDCFTRGKRNLILVIDPRIEGDIENITKNLKKLNSQSYKILIKYNSGDRIIFFEYYGSIKKKIRLQNNEPNRIIEKIISFFKVDQFFLYQPDDKEASFKETHKDEILTMFG